VMEALLFMLPPEDWVYIMGSTAAQRR
jgi:hypothetical protein